MHFLAPDVQNCDLCFSAAPKQAAEQLGGSLGFSMGLLGPVKVGKCCISMLFGLESVSFDGPVLSLQSLCDGGTGVELSNLLDLCHSVSIHSL